MTVLETREDASPCQKLEGILCKILYGRLKEDYKESVHVRPFQETKDPWR